MVNIFVTFITSVKFILQSEFNYSFCFYVIKFLKSIKTNVIKNSVSCFIFAICILSYQDLKILVWFIHLVTFLQIFPINILCRKLRTLNLSICWDHLEIIFHLTLSSWNLIPQDQQISVKLERVDCLILITDQWNN